MAIPVALLFSAVRWWWNTLLVVFILCCIPLSVFQVWQHNYFYLHRNAMDYEKYKLVFLRTAPQYAGLLWKTPLNREWNGIDVLSVPEESFSPHVTQLIYDRCFPASCFEKPSLLLVEFDYGRDFTGDDPTEIEVFFVDSAANTISYYRKLYLFHYMEDPESRHGFYFYDIPAGTFTGPQCARVQLVVKDSAVTFHNRDVIFFGWKE